MPPDHPRLTSIDIIAAGGWHPRYACVLAIALDGDHAVAVVDGNGGWIGTSYVTFGRAPGRRKISIVFDGQRHHVPVSRNGASVIRPDRQLTDPVVWRTLVL